MDTKQKLGVSEKLNGAPIYEERMLSTSIHLAPRYLNNVNLNDIIQQTLKQKVEGRCISDGYIRPDSVSILSRNLGCMENHDFSGSITYTLKYKADICSPKEGQVIECIVDTHDETNSVCYVGDTGTSPVEIYLFREHYLGNTEYAALKKGKKIMVKVLEPHIEFGAEKVLISAVYLGSA
jgi:DNA-directed RNA polymerase subunit E'/Rpb7